EIGIILKEFEGGRVRYWHDVGHATVQENLGILKQNDLLETYSKDMIGIHLHDTKGMDDHLSPGLGEICFEEITPFIKSTVITILEVGSSTGREQLVKGSVLIREKLSSTDERNMAQGV
ncbi:hypothetical protein ACFL7M_18215, partial [Thermodesulfobacteriota bacterium]